MMKNLWFVSSFILVLISCNPFICKNIQTNNGANINAAVSFSDTLAVRRYKAKINYKTTEITGILICKKINNSTLAGVFINEFGIKGFDFTLTETGAKMGYVFKNLDKWYIRNILRRNRCLGRVVDILEASGAFDPGSSPGRGVLFSRPNFCSY